jgi:hypothetical protein
VTLVLDDLHLLTDPGALKGLDFMLRNAGSAWRLVATSRVDPLLPLHRYRLAGHLPVRQHLWGNVDARAAARPGSDTSLAGGIRLPV